ncbi:gb [Venturia nashicola]|uniref:Gb n=1 Tax=Venturia nashicola TaxID=86259 RepID=A0A4Z1NR52_9PEZI|nr:gb [Venturia nashicola]TLD26048.1 gb [Venturia nashicola]
MRDLDNHFGEYVHLKQLPREAEALTTLRKAASCVKPIMRKRGWRVGTLSEFLPEEHNLWGLNIDHGRQINLRLRHAADSNQFLQFEHVLDTLLHELCHIVHGPHDEIFHKLWDELRDEWTSLQIKGFTGEGFLGKGQQVGGRRIPVDEVRRQARVAAEQRAKISKVQAPGKRLGGKAPKPGRGGIRETIARAALSRTKVETGCATGTKAGDRAAKRAAEDSKRNGFRTKAEMDDANSVAIAEAMQELMELDEERVIDLSEQTPPSEGLTWSAEHGLQAAPPKESPWPVPNSNGMNRRYGEPFPRAPLHQRPAPSNSVSKKSVPAAGATTSDPRGRPVSRVVLEAEAKKKQFQSLKPVSTIRSEDLMRSTSQPSRSPSTRERWACLECTLVNEPHTTSCDVCEAPRPGFSQAATRPSTMASSGGYQVSATSGPLGWLCSCGTFMEDQWWTCTRCSKMRPSS